MSRVSLKNGSGPGSSISLAPETIKVRNALIEKFTGEPLDEMNHFMNTALATEKNELRRLGILAARIFLLRTRIANLKDFNRDPSLTGISNINVGTLDLGGANMDTANDDDGVIAKIEDGWSRLKITQAGEVHGVRFLSGAIIDAKPEDAEKLIQSGKAVRVDENGYIIELSEDGFDNQDKADSAAGAEASVEDANGATKPNEINAVEPDKNDASNLAGEQTTETASDNQDEANSAADAEDSAEDANGTTELNETNAVEPDESDASDVTSEQTTETVSDKQPLMAAAGDAVSEDASTAEVEQPILPDDVISDNEDGKT